MTTSALTKWGYALTILENDTWTTVFFHGSKTLGFEAYEAPQTIRNEGEKGLSHLRSYKSKKERRQRLEKSRREEFLHGVWPSWYSVKSLRAPHHKKRKGLSDLGCFFVSSNHPVILGAKKIGYSANPHFKDSQGQDSEQHFPKRQQLPKKGHVFVMCWSWSSEFSQGTM